MKIPTILMMILTIGCEPSEHARDASPVGNAVHPAVVRSARPPQRNNHRYRLVGLPTGDRLFFDQGRCLRTLQTYAVGMEAGLGTGSSTGLHCEPERPSLTSASPAAGSAARPPPPPARPR